MALAILVLMYAWLAHFVMLLCHAVLDACRFTLFFEFATVVYGLASTLLPNRLPRARYAIAQ